MSTSSSLFLSDNIISFRNLTEIELSSLKSPYSELSKKQCPVTQTKKWNLSGYHKGDYKYYASHPCIARVGETCILTYWSVLQLMRMYDLRLEGKRVTQELPPPAFKGKYNNNLVKTSKEYLNKATHHVVHTMATLLNQNFSIVDAIKKKYGNAGQRSCRLFFEGYKEREAVEIFELFRKNVSVQQLGLIKSFARTLNDLAEVASQQESSSSSNSLVKSEKRLKFVRLSASKRRLGHLMNIASQQKSLNRSKRLRPADLLSSSSKPTKRLKPLQPSSSSRSSSKLISEFHGKRVLFDLNLQFLFQVNTQEFTIRSSSHSQTLRIRVHELLKAIPISMIKSYFAVLNLPLQPLGSSLDNRYLVFQPLNDESKYFAEDKRCAVTGTSQWNLHRELTDVNTLPVTYPCVAKLGESHVLVYWAVLQLMIAYDLTLKGRKVNTRLTFKGRKVIIDFKSNQQFTHQLIQAVANSSLRKDFDIRKGIQKKFKHFSVNGEGYDMFFEQRRGQDVVEIFREIMVKPRATHPDQHPFLSNSEFPPTLSNLSNFDQANIDQIILTQNIAQRCFHLFLPIASNIQSAIQLSYQQVLNLVPKHIIQDHLFQRTIA